MVDYTLYALIVGLQSNTVAETLGERFDRFIASRQWCCPDVWSICQQNGAEDWELGLNLCLPWPLDEVPDWFSDVEAIVRFCVGLRGEFHHDFVVGAYEARTDGEPDEVLGGDLLVIGATPPDYDDLRRRIAKPGSA